MRSRTWAGALVAAMLLTACGAPGESGGAGGATGSAATTSAPESQSASSIQQGGELVYASIYDPRSLDPARDNAAFTLFALRQLYDGLVVKDKDGEIYPHLATDWESSDDNLTWTFNLRPGVVFHDGTPLNAEAVKFSLDRVRDEETASPGANILNAAIADVTVVDEDTVEITLPGPYAPFLSALASSWAYIVSPSAVEKFGEDFGSNPVGTGAFKFVSWQKEDRLILERNPDYAWAAPFQQNQGPAYLDRIVMRQISDPTALGASMETDEVQLLGFVDVTNAERLTELGHTMELLEAPSSGWLYYMNTEKAPTDDVLVRRAIAHAVDLDAIAQTPLWRGDGEQIYGPLNPNHPYASETVADELGFHYDPDLARSLLEEAGWTEGPDGIRVKDGERLVLIDVTNSETPRYSGSATIMQQQLREVGIETQIDAQTQATFSQAQARGDHNIAIRTNVGFDPSVIFSTMLGCDAIGVPGQNLARYCDPEMDELLEEGVTTFDEDERFAIYEEVQRRMMEEALAKPWMSRRFIFEIHQDVGGYIYDSELVWYGSDLYFKGD